MELLYKIEGCVSYDTVSNIVIYRAQQMQDMNIPVECILHENRYLMPAIEFSFYKRADEHFEEKFLDFFTNRNDTQRWGTLYCKSLYRKKQVSIVRGGVIFVKACY